MNLNANIKLKGELSIKKYNKDNKLIQELNVPNLIVNTGKEYIASRMIGASSAVMSHMAIGTTDTTPVAGNTILNAEVARAELNTPTVSGVVATYTATFGVNIPNTSASIVEAGIFNSATANQGTMLCHTKFPTVNKDTNEIIVITWNISVG